MNWLWKLIGKLTGWEKQSQEYWDRFFVPQIERARAMGFTDDEIGVILETALVESDGRTVFPAMRFRDLLDSTEEAADDR
jgi:hypothetical protein